MCVSRTCESYEIDAEVEGKKIILFEKSYPQMMHYRTDNTFLPTVLKLLFLSLH
jgi:hypothetical protein